MKLMMRNLVKRLIAGLLSWLPSTFLGRYVYQKIINAAMIKRFSITELNAGRKNFPNRLSIPPQIPVRHIKTV